MTLMKIYDLTEDGYHREFRTLKPETDESPNQFIDHLSTYLERWVKLSETEQSFKGVRDLIVKEQFINSCSKELTVYRRE